MSANQSIAQIYKDNQKSFLKHLKKAKNLGESSIHKLRVDIKNTRVFVSLLKTLSKEKTESKRILKIISPVFKNAGDIRTTTLNLKLIQSSRSKLLLKFKQHLKKQNKEAEKKFQKKIKKFGKKKFNKYTRINHSVLKKIKGSEVQHKTINRINKALVEVRISVSETQSDKNLHDIRKELKTVKNLGIILKEINSLNPFDKSLENTDHLYKQIGKWHDSSLLADDLQAFANSHNKISPNLKNNLFINKLKAKNKRSKSIIIKNLIVYGRLYNLPRISSL
ncbi:MAG: CHAD domain-containing protein [Burkholderiales bacterium]|nr:CHAD domain-containing protein [Bacteroidia bacterium]